MTLIYPRAEDCPRCEHDVPIPDDGSDAVCPYCGCVSEYGAHWTGEAWHGWLSPKEPTQ